MLRRRSRALRLRWTPTSGCNARDLYQRPPAQRRGFFYARSPDLELEHGAAAPGERLPACPKESWGSRLPAARSRCTAPGARLPAPAPGSRLPAPGSRLPAPGSRCAARVPRISGQTARPAALELRRRRAAPGRWRARARAMFFTNNHQNFDMTSRGGILMLNVPYVSRETTL